MIQFPAERDSDTRHGCGGYRSPADCGATATELDIRQRQPRNCHIRIVWSGHRAGLAGAGLLAKGLRRPDLDLIKQVKQAVWERRNRPAGDRELWRPVRLARRKMVPFNAGICRRLGVFCAIRKHRRNHRLGVRADPWPVPVLPVRRTALNETTVAGYSPRLIGPEFGRERG